MCVVCDAAAVWCVELRSVRLGREDRPSIGVYSGQQPLASLSLVTSTLYHCFFLLVSPLSTVWGLEYVFVCMCMCCGMVCMVGVKV